jgi:hypothetical protein
MPPSVVEAIVGPPVVVAAPIEEVTITVEGNGYLISVKVTVEPPPPPAPH